MVNYYWLQWVQELQHMPYTKYLLLMTYKEKLHRAFYQTDRLWTCGKAIKELHKITSVEKTYRIMFSKTSPLAGSYATSKGNKSSSLRCDKT